MLVHRLRRWTNINPASGASLVFVGMSREAITYKIREGECEDSSVEHDKGYSVGSATCSQYAELITVNQGEFHSIQYIYTQRLIESLKLIAQYMLSML